MCHGRLTEGPNQLRHACPENAIEIEIVDQLEWRSDYAAANAPVCPTPDTPSPPQHHSP